MVAFSRIGSASVKEETLRAPEGILRERMREYLNRNTGGARAAIKGRGVWQSEKRSFLRPPGPWHMSSVSGRW